jgi:predicted LPLAT superfamily acyltransferase
MASNAALQWQDGRGWLVLAGSANEAVRARALAIGAADGGIAYLATQGVNTAVEQILTDMEDLGAPSGYLVDVLTEDDPVIQSKLAEASMIVIGGDSSVSNVRSALLGAAIAGIQQAFENGAVVLAEGAAAMTFGAWLMQADGKVNTGFGWLSSGLIVPGINSVSESPITRIVLAAQPTALAVGIGAGSALALGPDGEVETWGERQVSIALGPTFGA